MIQQLKKNFELDLWQPEIIPGEMSVSSILYAVEFNNYLDGNQYDAIIIRGDRYEMLGLAMVAVYKGFKVIHIEGGDLSGVVDNKVRHAIAQLSDFHFCTNSESHRRLINMGIPIEKVYNYGSLDVEYALSVEPKQLRDKGYILVAFHPIAGEDPKELDKALESFKEYDIIKIGSNTDYGKKYGQEEFSPRDYINLLRFAQVCVGNSSSLLKEASVLGVSVVNIGNRQVNRLRPKNVLDVPCEQNKIELGIQYQLKNKYTKDLIYFRKNTSKEIVKTLKKIL